MKVEFTIPGQPFGKERPRVRKVGEFSRTYTPTKTVNYENYLKLVYSETCCNAKFPDDAMLDVRIYAFYSIPKNATKKAVRSMIDKILRPTKKPDCDNIGKIVCDSLNNIAYKDDSQIVDLMVRKFYSENPRVVVTIKEAETCRLKE